MELADKVGIGGEARTFTKMAVSVLAVFALLSSACGDDSVDGDENGSNTTEQNAETAAETDEMAAAFPVNIETQDATVTIEAKPERIVSLSPASTEMLYAIGAGDQVVAADEYSNYPDEVPNSISGFPPELEAILAEDPDLVVLQPGKQYGDLAAAIEKASIPVLGLGAAKSLDGVYEQVAQLGEASGQIDGAAALNKQMRADVDAIVAGFEDRDEPVRVYHEIDSSLFMAAPSDSFVGAVYEAMGIENIAGKADGDLWPTLDVETIFSEDPTLIVVTNSEPDAAEAVSKRAGWENISAVKNGNVIEVDADEASRWGPRVVLFMQDIAAQIEAMDKELARTGS